jgi:S1-C subfamily serine protease
MLKKLLLLGALLIFLGGSNTVAASVTPDYRQKHREMLYTVVLIRQSMGSGSGTVIWSEPDDRGEYHSLILTNHHVIRSAIKIEEVWDPKLGKKIDREKRSLVRAEWHIYNDYSHMVGSKSSRAEIVAYDQKLDLALLRLLDRERRVSPVAHFLPEGAPIYLFDEVTAVGAGLGEPPFATQGNLAFLDKIIQGEDYFLSSAPIIFGNSGGAMFRYSPERRRYELIGVPSKVSAAGWQAVSHMSWSIPVNDTVREFLRENCYHAVLREVIDDELCEGLGELKKLED